MRHAAPVLGGGGELQAKQLLAGGNVPEAEVHLQAAIHEMDLTVDHGLGTQGLPDGEIRLDGHF